MRRDPICLQPDLLPARPPRPHPHRQFQDREAALWATHEEDVRAIKAANQAAEQAAREMAECAAQMACMEAALVSVTAFLERCARMWGGQGGICSRPGWGCLCKAGRPFSMVADMLAAGAVGSHAAAALALLQLLL